MGICVGVGSALLPMALSPSLPNIFLFVLLEVQAFANICDWLLEPVKGLVSPPKRPATELNLAN